MARDFSITAAMSAPAESLISQIKCIVADKRHSALPGTIKMLAIFKSRGIISDQDIESIFMADGEDGQANITKDQQLSHGTTNGLEIKGVTPLDDLQIRTRAYYSDD